MDLYESLKHKLQNGQQIFMPTMSPEWAPAAPAYAEQGVDCVLVDCEHMPVGIETLRRTLASCRAAGLPCIIRVPDAEYHLISRTLDAGADGILVPRVEAMEQAATAVMSTRFPPEGKKGCGGPGIFRPGETVEDFNRNRVLFLQIESPAGIDRLPEMLGRYDRAVDGVIVGPTDLSISLGIPMQLEHPSMLEEIRRLIAVCAAHHKPCGMYLWSRDAVRFWRREGMRILWNGSDRDFASAGAGLIVRRMKELGEHE